MPSRSVFVLLLIALTILGVSSFVTFQANAQALSPNNGGRVIKIFTIPSCDPQTSEYQPKNGFMYVSASCGGVFAVNASSYKTVHQISVSCPGEFALDKADGNLYVANPCNNVVEIVDTYHNRVTGQISVGSSPCCVAYDPANKKIYVVNSGSDSVSVLNVSQKKVLANISVGSNPMEIAYDPANHEIYVANSGSNTVSAISGVNNTVVATISVEKFPLGLAYAATTKTMWVSTAGIYVEIINSSTNKIAKTLDIGGTGSPGKLGFDPFNGYMYLDCGATTCLIPINTKTYANYLLDVEGIAWSIGVDPVNRVVFVNIADSYNITVVGG